MLEQQSAAVSRSAREARRRIRTERVSRRPLRARLLAAADVALYAAMFAGLVTGAAQAGLEQSGRLIPLIGPERLPLIRWTVLIAVVMLVITGSKLLLTFGPVLVRGPVQTWLLSSPIDRRSLLTRVFLTLVCVGVVGGEAIAVLAVVAAQLSVSGPLLWLVGGVAGVAVVSATVLIQRHHRARRAQRGLTVALMGCVLALVVVLVMAPQSPPFAGGLFGDGVTWALGLALCTSFVVGWMAWRALGRLNRAALVAGSDVAEATAVATTFLEPAILWSLLLLRRARSIARVRSVALRGPRVAALIKADFTRLRRSWAAMGSWLCLAPVPYLAGAVLPAGFVPAVQLVAAFLVTNRLASGLRIMSGSTALRRAIGGSDRALQFAHLVIPAAGSVLWCLLTAPAIPGIQVLASAISAVGAILVTYRIATRPPIEYASPMLDMGFGGVPIGLVIQLSRGPALLIILCWLQISIAS